MSGYAGARVRGSARVRVRGKVRVRGRARLRGCAGERVRVRGCSTVHRSVEETRWMQAGNALRVLPAVTMVDSLPPAPHLGLFSGHFGSLFCAFSRAALVLWCLQMNALTWSFDLPESRLRKSCWRRDLTKKRFSGFFLSVLAHFALFWVAWIGLQLCR